MYEEYNDFGDFQKNNYDSDKEGARFFKPITPTIIENCAFSF